MSRWSNYVKSTNENYSITVDFIAFFSYRYSCEAKSMKLNFQILSLHTNGKSIDDACCSVVCALLPCGYELQIFLNFNSTQRCNASMEIHCLFSAFIGI